MKQTPQRSPVHPMVRQFSAWRIESTLPFTEAEGVMVALSWDGIDPHCDFAIRIGDFSPDELSQWYDKEFGPFEFLPGSEVVKDSLEWQSITDMPDWAHEVIAGAITQLQAILIRPSVAGSWSASATYTP